MPDGIQINVGIKNAAYHKGLDEMRSGAKKFKGELSGMFASAIVPSAVIAGFAALTTRVVNFVDDVNDLSERFGVSTDIIQRWGNIAQTAGSSAEAVTAAFAKLIVNQSKALQGDKELVAHFAALGVTLQDLSTMNADQIMEKIGHSSMESADMVAVLGRNALELVSTLQAVADGAAKLGAVIDEKNIKVLAQLKDDLITLTQTGIAYFGNGLGWLVRTTEELAIKTTIAWKTMGALVVGTSKAMGEAIKLNLSGAREEMVSLQEELARISTTGQIALGKIEKDPVSKGPREIHEDDEKKKDSTDKIADAKKRIADLEEQARRSALEGEAKLNYLAEERAKIYQELMTSHGTEDALASREKLLKIDQDIAAERKKQDEDKARSKAKFEEDLKSAREDEAKAQLEYDRGKMTSAEKVKSLEEEKAKVMKEASESFDDPAKSARKHAEAIGIQQKIDDEKKRQEEDGKKKREDEAQKKADAAKATLDRQRGAAARISVDSLQAVGGGGRAALTGSDPALREAQNQTALLREAVATLRGLQQNQPKARHTPTPFK